MKQRIESMKSLTRTCPLCDGSQSIRIGDRRGERCDYCLEGELLTIEGDLLSRLIKRYIEDEDVKLEFKQRQLSNPRGGFNEPDSKTARTD
jgi:hypothetical protein